MLDFEPMPEFLAELDAWCKAHPERPNRAAGVVLLAYGADAADDCDDDFLDDLE